MKPESKEEEEFFRQQAFRSCHFIVNRMPPKSIISYCVANALAKKIDSNIRLILGDSDRLLG